MNSCHLKSLDLSYVVETSFDGDEGRAILPGRHRPRSAPDSIEVRAIRPEHAGIQNLRLRDNYLLPNLDFFFLGLDSEFHWGFAFVHAAELRYHPAVL